MFPALSLPVPPHLLVRLLQKLEASGDARDLGALAVQLLEQWLAAEAPDEGASPAAPAGGYLWKEVFLPNGTVLRGFGNSTAVVRDGRLLHQGRPTTPNRFCCGSHHTSHNAWKAISIQRPGDPVFTRAWQLRREAHGLQRVRRPWFEPREAAAPLREPFPDPHDGKVPLCDPQPLGAAAPAASVRRGGPAATAPTVNAAARAPARRPDHRDRWCAPLDIGGTGGPPEPRSDPGEPVMIISRERRKHHARRVTDSIWDE